MYDYNQILKTLENPNENGILIFVLGFLFTLSVYHIVLFFQNKDKVYFYYGIYTTLILVGYLHLVSTGFFGLLIKPFTPFLESFEVFFKWMFNCLYFIFAFKFVEVKLFSKKWSKIILYPIYILIPIGFILQILSLVTQDKTYIHEGFFLFFVPIILVLSIIGYYILFKIKSSVRYYIIIGSLVLFISSVSGAFIYYLELLPKENHLRDSIFYFGLIVENIFFSLGLGHKQKLMYEEKNKQKEINLQLIIEGQETERARIARELHDGVVQEIGSVILKSRNILSKMNLLQAKESQELLETLENSNQDLRNISHQMMPRALKELGITSALNDLLEGSLKFVNIKFTFDHFNIKERLPAKIEITLYRITQELLNNIIKHSKANEVSVQLFKSSNTVILIVEDNGIGFSIKKEFNKGIGLLNISSRLDVVKGSVNFEPSPKSGTLVTVKIPL